MGSFPISLAALGIFLMTPGLQLLEPKAFSADQPPANGGSASPNPPVEKGSNRRAKPLLSAAELIPLLGDPSPAIRARAAQLLGQMGSAASTAVSPLASRVADSEEAVRREAILALAALGPSAAPAVPALTKALDDTAICAEATYALGKIGMHARPAAKAIGKNATSRDAFLRLTSLWALAAMHPDDKELAARTVAALVEGMSERDPLARQAAARALADLTGKSNAARASFRDLLAWEHPNIASGLLANLAQAGESSVPALIVALQIERLQPQAAALLGRLGPASRAAIDPLLDVLDTGSLEAQGQAVLALGAMGPAAAPVVPSLARRLPRASAIEAINLAYSLGRIGPSAQEAVPALRKSLGSKDSALAGISAWALVQISPASEEVMAEAVPVLAASLSQPDARVRHAAADALRRLGPRAQGAAAALVKAQQSDDQTTRALATAALQAVNGSLR